MSPSPAPRRPARRPVRSPLALGILALLLLCVGVVVAGTFARQAVSRGNGPPGELVDVGGFRLHLHCVGSGGPPVILEAGLLDFSVVWAHVQPAVAKMTRTCAYDRAGSGWSDAGPDPRTSGAMVAELHTLLARADVRPPFVLVGHSFGGMNLRLFASRYPEEVAGLVLVDAAHPDQWDRIPELREASAALARQFRSLSRLGPLGVLALVRRFLPDRGLPPGAAERYRSILAATPYFRTVVAELESVDGSAEEVRRGSPAAPAELPVVVISRGRPAPLPGLDPAGQARVEEQWRALQAELTRWSPHGTHLVAGQSAHDVPLEQPRIVAEAITRLVVGVRATAALPPSTPAAPRPPRSAPPAPSR